MSKMDDLRAMREARFDQTPPRSTRASVAPKTTTRPSTAAERLAAPPQPAPSGADEPEAPLCGHRAISGRTCTREHGHAAKSHRYS